MSISLAQLGADPARFPDPGQALREPNGLLAVGGDLSPARLLSAYHKGIFPWYEPYRPILWWSPDPRGVLEPGALHEGRTLRKQWRRGGFEIWINRDFNRVIERCAAPRRSASDTWISKEMMSAYRMLHHLGHAHSVEIWQEGRAVAGLYGLSLGRVFCGESMFGDIDGGARLAMVALCRHLHAFGGELIDTQMQNPFLATLGVQEWPRPRFLTALKRLQALPLAPGCWIPREVHYD